MDGRCPHRHTPKVVDSEECESEWRAVGEQRPRTGTATWIGSQKRLAQSQEIAKVRLGVLSYEQYDAELKNRDDLNVFDPRAYLDALFAGVLQVHS